MCGEFFGGVYDCNVTVAVYEDVLPVVNTVAVSATGDDSCDRGGCCCCW